MNIDEMKKIALEASDLLKVMAHPERLMVLCQLAEGEMGASSLLEKSALGQSAFSQHLSVLRKHGIVQSRKSAQMVFYSLADPRAEKLLETMHAIFCRDLTRDSESLFSVSSGK